MDSHDSSPEEAEEPKPTVAPAPEPFLYELPSEHARLSAGVEEFIFKLLRRKSIGDEFFREDVEFPHFGPPIFERKPPSYATLNQVPASTRTYFHTREAIDFLCAGNCGSGKARIRSCSRLK